MTLIKRFRAWQRGERGLSEAAAAIIIFPFLIAAMFTIVEIGFYMQTRLRLDYLVQDAVRHVAIDGGDNNPNTNQINNTWSAAETDNLTQLCNTKNIRCDMSKPMTITCTPPGAAVTVGETVTCVGTLSYKPIMSWSSNPAAIPLNFGFSTIYTTPISITIKSLSSTGTNSQ